MARPQLPHRPELTAGFPAALAANVLEVQERIRFDHPPSAPTPVRVGQETIRVPYRLYGREPLFTQFSGTERAIAACVFSCNPSGYVRETWLRELLTRREPWVYPYVLARVGDYVAPIVELVASQVDRLDASGFAQLVEANPDFTELVRQRAISYWNREHTRGFEASPAHAVLVRFGAIRGARARAGRASLRLRACG